MQRPKSAPARKRGVKTVTIREIAEEAGVSTATVSRVLNEPMRVSRRARDIVTSVIERHHYVSHGLAGGLASRRSRLLGLVIPTITNSIYASSTQAIQQAAQAAGYTVVVGVSEFSAEHEALLIHSFIEHRVEGLILTGAERDPAVYDKITRNHVPFVITWKFGRGSGFPCISFNNRTAAAVAVEHLILLGHRRIGLVCGRTDLNDRARGRREGYVATLRAHGLEVDPDLIFERDFEFVEGRAAMHRMLQNPDRPTAVFCANDIQAIGALYECRQAGLDVPVDMSIIGFDDLPITQYVVPQLTTIRVPAGEMGRRATEALLETIRSGRAPLALELSADLIIRGSTAPPTAVRHRRARVVTDRVEPYSD
jgi:LacI family transcriptional regulator